MSNGNGNGPLIVDPKKLAELRAQANGTGEPAVGAAIQDPPDIHVTRPTTRTEPEDKRLENMKIYRSRVPGSRFIFKNGKEIIFTRGWYETSDKEEQAQLDEVANKVPTVYTDPHEAEIIRQVNEARRAGIIRGDTAELINAAVAAHSQHEANALGTQQVVSAAVEAQFATGKPADELLQEAIKKAGANAGQHS